MQNLDTTKKTGQVQGVVLDATSNEPIRNALVILRKNTEPGIGAYSDEAGNFVLRDVDLGTYLISLERSGFVAEPQSRSKSITVNAGDAGESMVLKLNRTGAVSGHVVDAEGEAVTGASVQLQAPSPKKNQAHGGYATSDDRGLFRIYNIPPGKYKMSATYSGRAPGLPVKIQAEKDKTKDAYGTTYYPGTLDPAQATTIQVDPAADIQGIDVVLHHTKTVRVRGKVTSVDGELPAPFVLVALDGRGADTQVQPDGSFELTEVPPGKYSLTAMALLQQGSPLAARQHLEVGENDIDGVQLTLVRAQTVTGSVLLPKDRKLPKGLIVFLIAKDPSSLQIAGQSGGLTQMTEQGTFSVANVLPGDYDLMVGSTGKGDDLYVAGMRSGEQDVFASGIHIGNAAPHPIEVVLKANGAEIECTVLDDKQLPVPEAHVTLLPDPPRRSQKALRAEGQTDASGKCTLPGIAPGDYHAFAVPKDDLVDFNDATTMESLEKMGKGIQVVEGDRKALQISVIPSDN